MRTNKKQAKKQKAAEKKVAELREQARALKEQARAISKDAGLDRSSELTGQASELATRLRDSDALAKAQTLGSEYATKAREAVQEAGWDERAAEVAKRVKESDQYKTAGQTTDKAISSVGGWLATGPAADKLGLKPAKKGMPGWLVAVLGVAAGVAAGLVAGALAGSRKPELVDELTSVAKRVDQDTPDIGAPAAQKPLADEIRTRMGEDPRTAQLPKLNVNVAEGTVFVRGPVPEGTDEDAIRAVVASVPGVQDVDLQLTVSGQTS